MNNPHQTTVSCPTAAPWSHFDVIRRSAQRKYVLKDLYDAGVKEFKSIQECPFNPEEELGDIHYRYYFDLEGNYLGVYR